MTPERTIRDDVIDAVDNGTIDKDILIISMLKYMRLSEISDMLHENEIFLDTGHHEED